MCTEAHRPPSSVDGAFNKDNNLCCTPQELVPLWHNALRWLDQGRKGVVGVLPSLTDLPSLYGPSGLSCRNTDFTDDLSVFVSTVYCDEKAQEMQDFVMEGGGLLIGGHAWDWCSCNPELNPLTDFAGTSTTISSVFTGMPSLAKDVYKRKGVNVLSIGKPVGACERLQ